MVKVNLIGFKEFSDRLKAAPAKMSQQVSFEVLEAANQVVRLAKRDAPRDQGQIKNALTARKIDLLTAEAVSGAEHSVFIEFGTKGKYRPIPGIDASKFKVTEKGSGKGLYDKIRDWVKRQGIGNTYSTGIKKVKGGRYENTGKKGRKKKASDAVIDQIAFAIMLSILKNGIKPQPFFFKQIAPVKKQFTERIEKLISKPI